jgi:hypothetical protein
MRYILTLLTSLLLAPLATIHAAEPVTIDLTKRTWQGIPGLERTAKGRVFVSWFTGGTKEPEPENTVVLSHSDDGGKTFSAPQAMALPLNDGTRCYNPACGSIRKGGSGISSIAASRTAPGTESMRAFAMPRMLRHRCGARSFASGSTPPSASA